MLVIDLTLFFIHKFGVKFLLLRSLLLFLVIINFLWYLSLAIRSKLEVLWDVINHAIVLLSTIDCLMSFRLEQVLHDVFVLSTGGFILITNLFETSFFDSISFNDGLKFLLLFQLVYFLLVHILHIGLLLLSSLFNLILLCISDILLPTEIALVKMSTI